MEFLRESIRGHSWDRVKHSTDIYHAGKDWEGSMRLTGVGTWLGKVVSFMILYVDSRWLTFEKNKLFTILDNLYSKFDTEAFTITNHGI